jgi:hypothetical protein
MVESKPSPSKTRRSAAVSPVAPPPGRRHRQTSDSATSFTADERSRMVETAAYYRAERRGFIAGHETDDWLAAEAEIDALIASSSGAVSRRAPRARKLRDS